MTSLNCKCLVRVENPTSGDASAAAGDMIADQVVQEIQEIMCNVNCHAFDDENDVCLKSCDLIDPSFYSSRTFFAFDMTSYNLMKVDLAGNSK